MGHAIDLRAPGALLRGHDARHPPIKPITGARVLALLGDSVTTDHISPAGAIEKNGPAARYLTNNDVLAQRLQSVRRAARQS